MSPAVGASIVTVMGAGVVANLSGFTIEGPGDAVCGTLRAGVAVQSGAYAVIHDNEIRAIRNEPLLACAQGRRHCSGQPQPGFARHCGDCQQPHHRVSKGGRRRQRGGRTRRIDGQPDRRRRPDQRACAEWRAGQLWRHRRHHRQHDHRARFHAVQPGFDRHPALSGRRRHRRQHAARQPGRHLSGGQFRRARSATPSA